MFCPHICLYVCASRVPGALRVQKMASDPLEPLVTGSYISYYICSSSILSLSIAVSCCFRVWDLLKTWLWLFLKRNGGTWLQLRLTASGNMWNHKTVGSFQVRQLLGTGEKGVLKAAV